MKKLVKYPLLALFFALVTALAVQSPIALLQGLSNRMIAALEQNKARLNRPGMIHNIVRRVLIPHVDLNLMSALVVGPNYWRQATSTQKSQFKSEFTKMVISTYSAALASYDGDRVRFYPLRGGFAGRRTIQVRSMIIRRNGQRIPVSYNLILKSNSNNWFVYDFSVENVSIVQSYRAQFSGVLSRSGMDGLIQQLARHNQRT